VGCAERGIEFLFFICGIAIWVLVGRALDKTGSPEPSESVTLTAGGALLNSLALALEIFLFFSSLKHVLPAYR
jgi:hypothetical protein